MSVSYDKEQRQIAKKREIGLVKIAWENPSPDGKTLGSQCCWQGPVNKQTLRYIQQVMMRAIVKARDDNPKKRTHRKMKAQS